MNTSTISDAILCPGCGHGNAAHGHFCRKCAAPLSTHATTDPVGSLLAEGYAARRAVNKPDRPIILIGLWLWLLPIVCFSVVGLVGGLGYVLRGFLEPNLESIISGLVAASVSVFFLTVTGPMLSKSTRNFMARQADGDID